MVFPNVFFSNKVCCAVGRGGLIWRLGGVWKDCFCVRDELWLRVR